MMISKTSVWFLAGVLTLTGAGCHELQRHRLDRWNRVPDSMPGSDYSFSIPDPPMPATPSEQPSATCTSNVCAE